MVAVESARERVARLAREIEEDARSDLPPKAFFQRFLQRVLAALGAPAGAVWLQGDSGLGLVCELNVESTGLSQDPDSVRRNQALLGNVLATGESAVVTPDAEGEERAPTGHCHVFAALHADDRSVGVVQVFQRPDAPPTARLGYLQFVEQMAGLASRYLARRKEASDAKTPAAFKDDLLALDLEMQRTLDVKDVAATAANDGRLMLDCARVSVLVKKGRRTDAVAVSGTEKINRRANVVRLMEKLVREVVKVPEPFLFAGRTDDVPPQIERVLADFVDESGSRSLVCYPLLERPEKVDEKVEEGEAPRTPPRVIGCIVVEQRHSERPTDDFLERVELLATHVAAALQNARKHRTIFLLPIWTAVGGTFEWFHGRKLPKTMMVLGAITAVVASLVFVPWEYRVHGEGRLMPVERRQVFAPVNGQVEELSVFAGKKVAEGEVLLRIHDEDLAERLLQTQNELTELGKRRLALRAGFDEAVTAGDRTEEINVRGQLDEVDTQIAGLSEREATLLERVEELTVRSPIDGIVVTFQVEELLRNRPVHRGDVLLEVADENQDWRLELLVEDRRMGHVNDALAEYRREHGLPPDSTDVGLPVEYVLATATEHNYFGKVAEVSPRARPSEELGNVFEVNVELDRDTLPKAKIGADVRARIDCGQKSLGYVLFGDVVEFFRGRLWW